MWSLNFDGMDIIDICYWGECVLLYTYTDSLQYAELNLQGRSICVAQTDTEVSAARVKIAATLLEYKGIH